MLANKTLYDAVVIGGGFYGCSIAIYLVEKKGLKRVLLIEENADLMTRASYVNQARVHNGYHYPRSYTTAFRSRVNFPLFTEDWPDAIKSDFEQIYAIAKNNSKVTAKQFQRFCNVIGADIVNASKEYNDLFNKKLIESTYKVKEYAFDASVLSFLAKNKLHNLDIETLLSTKVKSVFDINGNNVLIRLSNQECEHEIISKTVFNCTYSSLNQMTGDFSGVTTKRKHEVTEIALIQPHEALSKVGITVMDGSYFSVMPFPAKKLHSLTHVRYTPHLSWEDSEKVNPSDILTEHSLVTRVDRMIRDAKRYLPIISESKYIESLFEVKTVLQKNEGDDGRPILFEKSTVIPGFYSILGGKIDNIYDIFEKIDTVL